MLLLQLGINSTVNMHVPTVVPALLQGVLAVSLGGEHSCAIDISRALFCWGANDRSQVAILTDDVFGCV
jgi:alpha-tubulin suppressor-like RCC1 family protein